TLAIIRRLREKNLVVGAAVGPFDDERVKQLVDSDVSIIVIDTAHGYSKNVIDATRRYSQYSVPIMAGNIVTGEAARTLIEAGASSLRVGVGPGHACTTREIAGVGMPQLTAIADVADVAVENGVSVVADGGIEKPADVVKALAIGADAVMLGYLLAGTHEAPGAVVYREGRCYKVYRGMGSRGALRKGSTRYGEFKRVPEGVEGLVECRGSARSVVEWIVGGLIQGMGYVGARNLSELRERARFVKLLPGGFKETGPRGFVGKITY
ncbi:MAG: IMP dehydrogenase, partial [Thermoprotei archaeon]